MIILTKKIFIIIYWYLYCFLIIILCLSLHILKSYLLFLIIKLKIIARWSKLNKSPSFQDTFSQTLSKRVITKHNNFHTKMGLIKKRLSKKRNLIQTFMTRWEWRVLLIWHMEHVNHLKMITYQEYSHHGWSMIDLFCDFMLISKSQLLKIQVKTIELERLSSTTIWVMAPYMSMR